MTYSEIINSSWFSDIEGLRDALRSWADSVTGKVYIGTEGAIVKNACDADYIANYFTDECIQSEIIKRIPQKRIVEIYNYYQGGIR